MKSGVVKVYEDEPRAGTFLIAKGFEREHKKVVQLITKYKDRFERLENNKSSQKRLIIRKVPSKTAGRPVEEYLLNEQQTIFLGTLFRNTDIVLDFKERIALDFVELKSRLSGISALKKNETYQITRDAGKLVRKQTTDEMKQFVKYATTQGSKSAKMYYTNITRMMNGMLFIVEGRYKNLREIMSVQQLMTISSADQIINKAIKSGMKNNVFYKDIYKDVKSKVMMFAELHGKSEVINDCLKIDNK